jgi:hypothetical protein
VGPYLLLVGLPVGVLALFVLLGLFVLRAGARKES